MVHVCGVCVCVCMNGWVGVVLCACVCVWVVWVVCVGGCGVNVPVCMCILTDDGHSCTYA